MRSLENIGTGIITQEYCIWFNVPRLHCKKLKLPVASDAASDFKSKLALMSRAGEKSTCLNPVGFETIHLRNITKAILTQTGFLYNLRTEIDPPERINPGELTLY